jgi:hypothetical protein
MQRQLPQRKGLRVRPPGELVLRHALQHAPGGGAFALQFIDKSLCHRHKITLSFLEKMTLQEIGKRR